MYTTPTNYSAIDSISYRSIEIINIMLNLE